MLTTHGFTGMAAVVRNARGRVGVFEAGSQTPSGRVSQRTGELAALASSMRLLAVHVDLRVVPDGVTTSCARPSEAA